MSLIERLTGKQDENEPEKLSELENGILTQAAQWKMDGTPWWTNIVMRKRLLDEGLMKKSQSYYLAFAKLNSFGAFNHQVGGTIIQDDGPHATVPTISNSDDYDDMEEFIGTRTITYNQISQYGGRIRGRVEEVQSLPSGFLEPAQENI